MFNSKVWVDSHGNLQECSECNFFLTDANILSGGEAMRVKSIINSTVYDQFWIRWNLSLDLTGNTKVTSKKEEITKRAVLSLSKGSQNERPYMGIHTILPFCGLKITCFLKCLSLLSRMMFNWFSGLCKWLV